MRSGRRKRIRDLVETLHSDILSDFEDELNQYRYTNPKKCSFRTFLPKEKTSVMLFSRSFKASGVHTLSQSLWVKVFDPLGPSTSILLARQLSVI